MKRNISFGLVIILIGVIWLLSNLNVFAFSLIDTFFRSLSKLWPLILIGFGFTILFKGNAIIRLFTWVVVFLAILFYGIYGFGIYGLYDIW